MNEFYALLLFITTGLLVLVATFAWQRRSVKGMRALMILMLALAEWCLSYGLFRLASSPKVELFWMAMTHVATATGAALFLVFVLFYTNQDRWLNKWIYILMALESAVVLSVTAVDTGRMILSGAKQSETSGILFDTGLVFWLHSIYSYIILAIAGRFLVPVAVHGPTLYRRSSRLILAAALLPWAMSFVNFFSLDFTPNRDMIPLAFIVSGFIAAFSLFRIRLLNLVPIARSSVIDMLYDSVVVVDKQNRIIDVNPAGRRVLLSLQVGTTLIGQSITTFFNLWPRWIDQRAGQSTVPVEISIEVDSASRYYDLRVSPLVDNKNNQQGWVLLMHDVTRRKLAERRSFTLALEKERVKILTHFIRDASHEFRTPLAIIQSNMYLIGKIENPTTRQEKVAVIEKQVTRLSLLLDQLAILSRLDSGISLDLRPVNVDALVRQIIEKATFASDKISFQLDLEADLPPVLGDAYLLKEAFNQLVENAERFCSPHSQVTVSATRVLHQIQVEFRDTGPGIAPEVLPHIFERFYRLDTAHSTPGFGLGLPIAQKTIEGHKGTIQVESQPGKGTVFRVLLPIAPRTGSTAAR